MVNKATPSALTEQQQYQAMEQTLARAGYTHEAYVEERPRLGHGSLVFSTLNSPAEQSYGATGLEQAYNSRGSTQGIGLGGIATGASSMYGGGGSMQMYSPVSAGGYAQKRYAHTVRSSASSILSLGRQKAEPPVMILPHYNSPYESVFFNQPAIQHCLESIPESDVKQHQVVQHQSAKDHSVFVLDEPGWMQSTGYILSIVRGLEEIRQEGFTHVLKNLEAQMRPAALAIDFVIPDQELLAAREKERFWEFFNGLGDRVEPGTYLPHAPKASLCMPDMTVGNKNEEQRSEALTELIETESKYNARMQDLVNVYLAEARIAAAGPNAPLGKYEIRVIFSNIEQILAVSTDFLNDLREYQSDNTFGQSLGEICRTNLKRMGCYKQYLVRYKRAQETLSALSKKLPTFKAFQERCAQSNGVQILPNLLVEPTQRIVKYPLLFKGILSGTSEDSADVEGIRQAAEMASQIAHMTKAKPEQNAEVLFNIRNIIEHCPDTLLSQSRSAVTYLDGHETNMLTGERGKPITLILFSDKIMIARRPKGVSGEVLFQLKEDEDERKRTERREKDRKDRERKAKKDGRGDKMDDKDENENGLGAHGTAYTTAGFALLRKDWKFMGWVDLLKISISIVEQTDPEGLFCMTTQNHADTKDELWETTRGIMPEHLEKRDSFVSKVYETLTLAKAAGASILSTSSCPSDYTSRLHVAELELFCNVYTASQYRDVLYKGDVALLYTSGGAAGQALIDMTPFSRLPLFAGMIRATESGLRVMLKGKCTLNDSANAALSSEEENRFLDVDAFQIHLTELVANLQWTTYHFDPYQNAQLHFSKIYLRTDYLYRTASSFSRATTLRTRSLKKILDSTSPTHQQNFSSGYSNRHYSGSSSPSVVSPSGNASSPNSPGGGLVRHYQMGNFSTIGSGLGSSAPMSPRTPPRTFTVPEIKQQRQRDRPNSHLRGDGVDSVSGNLGIRLQQPPLPPNHQLQLGAGNVLRESVAAMGALIPPGPGRKKGFLGSMIFDSDLLKLELQNYRSAIAYEVLRIYLEEMYAYSPLVARADVQQKFGACLHHKKVGEMSELILLRCQTYLDDMSSESRYILGAIISCYIRLRNSKPYRGNLDSLSLKILALVMANSSESDCDLIAESSTSKKDQVSLLDIWAQFYPALWTDVSLQESETKFLGTITEDADFNTFNDGEDIDKLDLPDFPKPRNPQGLPTTHAEKDYCIEKDSYGADAISKKGYGFPVPLMVEEYCEEDCEVKLEGESDIGNVNDYPSVTDAVNISAALSEADLDVDSNRHSKDALGVKERIAHLPTDLAQTPFSGRRSRHMADYVRHLRGQITAITERNLDMVGRCLTSVQEFQSEIGVQWEMMERQQEHLKDQLSDSMEYQIRLEYENESIRDLYDEVTEENNIIFERFNEELENIFEAVNTPSEDIILTDAATSLLHDCHNQGSSGESRFSTNTMAHENHPCADSDHPPNSQLQRLLQKAIQDRSLAEQQARRAILQASYFRDLLERHGVEVETTDLFE
ncbi:hypothetical protein BGZ75_003174 [Mortierella antarctica]|nr:hypothetical protein BGZ75_003174 [Mortierella antarctica]